MDRFWLKSYPPGVPSDIDPSVYPSVVALLEESFAKYRDQNAYVCMDKAITFGEIDTLSQALAAWLQGRGLQKRRARGDHDAQRAAVSRRAWRPCCGPASSPSTSIRSTPRASSSISSRIPAPRP